MTRPSIALSVRQPWAWAIIHAGKGIENRSEGAARYMTYRGPLCIHAALGMTQDEYHDAAAFMALIGVTCPPPHQLLRGGVIGTVLLSEIVKEHHSPWFFGPRGLVLADAKPTLFIPCVGTLGFFDVKETPGGAPAEPLRWMLPKEAVVTQERLL